jgi:hypothetical protein
MLHVVDKSVPQVSINSPKGLPGQTAGLCDSMCLTSNHTDSQGELVGLWQLQCKNTTAAAKAYATQYVGPSQLTRCNTVFTHTQKDSRLPELMPTTCSGFWIVHAQVDWITSLTFHSFIHSCYTCGRSSYKQRLPIPDAANSPN